MRQSNHPPRSLLTSERSSSSSRSSTSSSVSSNDRKSRSRMKCLISLGLILPALAAVIGVVAWAVSAEAVWGPNKHASKLQGPYELQNGRGGYEIPVLEERSDADFHPKSVLTVSVPDGDEQARVISRDDPDNSVPPGLNNEPIPAQQDKDAADSKDPLYYVHFVPTKDSAVTSSTPTSTSVSDLLSKIISTSGSKGKGAPQFVVFAPMPDGLGPAKNAKPRKKVRYDDEEEEEEVERKIPRKRTKIRNSDADFIHASETSRSSPQRNGESTYTNQQGNQQYYPPQPAQGSSSQRTYVKQYTQDAQQQYARYNEQQGTAQSQQPQPPPYSSNAGSEAQASGDSDRLGLISGGVGPGKGLSVSIGGGHGIPFGPLGLLKNLFFPILPKPRVNLNGKVVFGVVLEKGVGFGGGKPAVVYRK
ncbi:uncharacterized protein [Centruroides vittatus]|uniref:uncharacterized protein n=1 Tax=Centruroides vittatus TaxID=120091 RepID=UPI00350EBFFE